jgi:hypothetical protein
MAQQPHKQTPYDQFNIEIPQKFPKEGISAAAANAIVNTETCTIARVAALARLLFESVPAGVLENEHCPTLATS